MARTIAFTAVMLLAALALLLVGVASVTRDVNGAVGDVHAVFNLLGLPLVIGLRQGGHRRLEFGWGILVLLVLPFAIAQGWTIWRLVKRSSE